MDSKLEVIKKEDQMPDEDNLTNENETMHIIKEEDVVVKVEVKDVNVSDSGDYSLIENDEYENLANHQFYKTEAIEDNKDKSKPQKRRGHYRKCPYCEKQFNDTSKLKYHIFTHTGEKPFVCEVCQQSFSHPRPLKRHMLLHKEKNIACPHCPKSFADNTLLELHLKYIGQKFTCSTCGNVYARKENLKAHERKHTGETPYSCNYCEEKFNMSYKLKVHMNSKHLNIERKLFVCEFCGKEYKKKSDLNEHTNTHTGDPTSKCELCQETFNTKTAHREHMNIHNKKHECKECGKCFGNARNLERHEKAHSGIKDFQCSVCAKPYTSLRSLQKHMEIKHDVTEGKKQTFSCELCNRSYTRADYLERHMSKH